MCGIALIKLRKPFQHYIDTHGTPMYGLQKLYIMMEKQRNRGQDGAGVAVIKQDVAPGVRYYSRYRSPKKDAIEYIFKKLTTKYNKAIKGKDKALLKDAKWLKENLAFTGEVLLGHLRYGTHGNNSTENCHPMLRQNNVRSRTLSIAGNFNMTNVDELFQRLITLGLHIKEKIDTLVVLEKIGHYLDEANNVLFDKYKDSYSGQDLAHKIEENIDLLAILKRSCLSFDGGYALSGVTGYGASFVVRDPSGIRPVYYYTDNDVVVVASEKPAIKTAFDIDYNQIKELPPGHAIIIQKDGSYVIEECIAPKENLACSFEHIYFSRGSDPKIYEERKALGSLLAPKILEAIDYDLKNTIFSFIPNTAEASFLGLIKGVEEHITEHHFDVASKSPREDQLRLLCENLSEKPRVEKLVIKDVKMRTFITDDSERNEMVALVYDTTYEVVKTDIDTLVIIDDSIVRGTTLEKSIIKMLDKLKPKKIIIVSSCPQIRYPDCYGIDMSKSNEFVAFRAVAQLAIEQKKGLLDQIYQECKEAPELESKNFVKKLYDAFSTQEISDKIAEIVRADAKAEVEVIYQTIENLHKACPDNLGDWYFSGNYPTKGGNRVVNRAFINYMEGKKGRAY